MHTEEELRFLAQGAASIAGTIHPAATGDGFPGSRRVVRPGVSIPDYQLAAWLMAAYLNPLSEQETAWLTLAMADSGERLDLTGLPKPWVDKHSTGGVGDKTTIVLLPLLAACGLTVVKMSGRGLGITGGTVDKLGSVPGFRMDLSPSDLVSQASRIGLAITGQTPNLAPADKRLYALRDATGTVGSIPLIVSSILSKKLAGGAETIVLDVKCGSGAFMKDLASARALALALRKTAELCGVQAETVITDMDQPLGRAVGNALEVIEAVEVLKGATSGRFTELCVRLAGITLAAAFAGTNQPAPSRGYEELARGKLADGSAFRKAQEWFTEQGAGQDLIRLEDELYCSAVRRKIFHRGESGWAARVDASVVGETVIRLGGGRLRKDDEINPSVGVEVHVEVGDRVDRGQLLFTIHAASGPDGEAAAKSLEGAVELSASEVQPPPLFIEAL